MTAWVGGAQGQGILAASFNWLVRRAGSMDPCCFVQLAWVGRSDANPDKKLGRRPRWRGGWATIGPRYGAGGGARPEEVDDPVNDVGEETRTPVEKGPRPDQNPDKIEGLARWPVLNSDMTASAEEFFSSATPISLQQYILCAAFRLKTASA
ncbi:hypothetical protein B0H16DRAFT_1455532 [Mycena metata]|uniref:Uncharacterized protein n=1 Tax=Mycena metata TaxID=1033252 RepID=A0AAD7JF98_9AGAR|nr:hypothetical protein B0H16DRAFT_1455532 [Mycena metata]